MAISILIVEDKEVWASKLRTMYEDILGTDCIARIANTYDKAEDMLKDHRQNWDLLSLDINLGDANGLDLLERAHERNWVKGAIVISGIEFDTGYIPIPAEKVPQLRVKLPMEVEKAFPGAMLLSKNPLLCGSDINTVNAPGVVDKILEIFKKELAAEVLGELASPSYILDVSEAEYDPIEPRVSVALKSSHKKVTVITGKYAKFLYLLARKKKTHEDYGRVLKEELLSIFFETATAQIAIDSVKRHLKTKEINPSLIMQGSPKDGFSLIESVEPIGIDRNFNPDYTLVVSDEYGRKDMAITIRFNRVGQKEERNFTDRDAIFLYLLADSQKRMLSVSAKQVVEAFEPDLLLADKSSLLELARQKVREFKDRLCHHEKPLDPYKLISTNQTNTGWRLNEDVKVEGHEVFPVTELDETKLYQAHLQQYTAQRSTKTKIEHVDKEEIADQVKAEFLAFLERKKDHFSQIEVRMLYAIFTGKPTEDFAEEHGREADEIEAEMIALKKKWHDLGGPDLE